MTDEVVIATETTAPTERPAWLPEKFKSGEDLAKSYHELEKKFSTPPDEYDLARSKYLDPDYAPIQEFTALAKEKRVPKEVIDKMVDAIDKYNDEFALDFEEEVRKLGGNAKERLQVLDNWAKVNLTQASYEAITGNLKSADAIRALEELRAKMMNSTTVVPNGNDANTNNVQTLADLQAELNTNLTKYKTDPKYRADLQGRMDIASKTSGFIDKVGA